MSGPRASRGARGLLLALLVGVLGAGPARAGSVVLLRSGPLGPYAAAAAGFRAAYRGQVVETMLDEGGSPAALERRIAAANPDVVVAIGLRAAIFARDRLPRTPLVFCVVPNFERHELTAGWITGVSNDVPPLTELTALRAAAPDVRRVGLLYGRDRGPGPLRQARAAAAAAGLTLIEAPLADLSELPGRARDLVARVDALWMPPDPTLATPEAFRFLLELSLQARKPLLVFSEALVRAGALVAVFPDYEWVGARAADGVRRIQAGERAGDIPVVPLRQTRVILNQSTARALGRDLPPTALHGAEVLQ